MAAFREVDKVVDALDQQAASSKLGGELADDRPRQAADDHADRLRQARRRATRDGAAGGARSDTIILVRLDPDEEGHRADVAAARPEGARSPGHGTDKINAAYELGGPQADAARPSSSSPACRSTTSSTSTSAASAQAVNAIGCVYVDIDRRYFNNSRAELRDDRHPARLPEAVRPRGARLRALPPRGHRPRPRRPPAGLPAPGQAAGRRRQADRATADKLIEDLRQVHELGHPQTAQEVLRLLKLAVVLGRPADPRGPLRGRDRGDELRRATRSSDAGARSSASSSSASRTTPGPRGELQAEGPEQAAQAARAAARELEDAAAARQGPGAPGRPAGRAASACPFYYPTVRTARRRCYAGPPRVYKHHGPERAQATRALPDGHQARPGRRVLRPPGHDLEGPADPREPVRGAQDRQPRRSSSTTTATALRLVAWRRARPSTGSRTPCSRRSAERQMLAIARSTRGLGL